MTKLQIAGTFIDYPISSFSELALGNIPGWFQGTNASRLLSAWFSLRINLTVKCIRRFFSLH